METKLLISAVVEMVLTIVVGILGFVGIRFDNKKIQTVAWVLITIILLGLLVLSLVTCEYKLGVLV